MRASRRALIYGFIAVMAALFVFGSSLASFYVNLLWFEHLGYDAVFWRVLMARALVGLTGALIFALILFANIAAAGQSLRQFPFGLVPPAYERYFRPRALLLGALAVSLLFGGVAGLSVAGEWQTVELYRNQVAWGISDPIFGRDVSFYVFSLPFYGLAVQFLTLALMLSLIFAAALYLVGGAIQVLAGRLAVQPRTRLHLAVLVAGLLVMKAAQYMLAAYQLVHSPRGVAFGASYTDLHAQLPALRILAVIALGAAVAALAAALRRSLRPLYWGVGTLVVSSFLLGTAWPALMQRFVVEPNELVRERPYIQHNIAYTRQAFQLDRIERVSFPAQTGLSWDAVRANPGTVENIRLWDYRPLLQSYRGLQNLRPYYDFHDVDIDRYRIGDRRRQVLVSARELNHDQLPPDAQTWVNVHLKYTHGYGVVMSPASEVGEEGQPRFYLRDIPPVSSVQGLDVTRPEIYYGEVIDEFAVVRTLEAEFDYPLGEENATTLYEGRGGIPIGPMLNRVAFALHTGNYNLLFSTQLTAESRALIFRTIGERVPKLAPFLRYDRDPYLVITEDGRLVWVQDAYTTASTYPYSEPYRGAFAGPRLQGANYVRNAVKVTVDAYHGDVTFYVFDPSDPIIRTYMRIFPTLFRPAEDMPGDLKEHVRYPEDLLRAQAEMLLTYHMTDVDTFYNKEDLWALPTEIIAGEQQTVEPYYLIMQLPQEDVPEFLLLLPFTPADREDFMIGWLAARSDVEHYGQLIAFEMPKQRPVSSPAYIEKRINQDPAIARDLALWNNQGNQVIRGNLLVIPIDDSILYVEPLYLQAGERGRPELARVIVAVGPRLAMRETFAEALTAVLGAPDGGPVQELPGAGQDDEPAGEDEADLARRALDLYRRAQERLRQGDLAGYASLIEQLGQVLERLVPEAPAEPETTGGP